MPLNILPEVLTNSDDNSSTRSTDGKHATDNNNQNGGDSSAGGTAHRPFSKSMSVVSMSSINCPPNELLTNLDGELCLMALEHILTLVASQTMFALKTPHLSKREKQLIRREVSSELMSYHDFVRKKVLIDHREHRDIYLRRKHGQVLMQKVYPPLKIVSCDRGNYDRNGSGPGPGPGSTANAMRSNGENQLRSSNNLRVNVVRKLHLQQQQERQQDARRTSPLVTGTPAHPSTEKSPKGKEKFEMSRMISPIASGPIGQKKDAPPQSGPIASTPCWQQSTTPPTDQNMMEEDENDDSIDKSVEDIEYYSPEVPNYIPLSFVQFVEEDYLHFMSNLFHVICQQND